MLDAPPPKKPPGGEGFDPLWKLSLAVLSFENILPRLIPLHRRGSARYAATQPILALKVRRAFVGHPNIFCGKTHVATSALFLSVFCAKEKNSEKSKISSCQPSQLLVSYHLMKGGGDPCLPRACAAAPVAVGVFFPFLMGLFFETTIFGRLFFCPFPVNEKERSL